MFSRAEVFTEGVNMSDTQIAKLLKLVKDLRNQIDRQQGISSPSKLVKDLGNQIDGQQGTSSPNNRLKADSFNENPQARIELQNKLGYRFKDEGLLKRAVNLFSENWENDHGIFKMLGKIIIQTCESYRLVKENPKISKGDVQTSLNKFFGGREYAKGARGLGLEAFVRSPSGNCRCRSKKSVNEIDCMYAALVGAVAVDSSIEQASSMFLALSR
ncbi:hypothetical protein SUGI_0313270 [Cryptomeria japonica]|uniref:uncharacterized protein LOC131054803 n=1 Tax=Cryptomeria japonica TaxID=3369 RepID=UPI002408BDA4|nr:uncharacterized protein LOC131054803 [Cryptomeria japonica]GLJ17893.1 hypothetical protein SUGI_0313270 [Cryptomeria japonica]